MLSVDSNAVKSEEREGISSEPYDQQIYKPKTILSINSEIWIFYWICSFQCQFLFSEYRILNISTTGHVTIQDDTHWFSETASSANLSHLSPSSTFFIIDSDALENSYSGILECWTQSIRI